MIRYLLLLFIFVLAGCGSGGGGGPSQSSSPTPLAAGSFWAVDFTTNNFYVVNAREVGQGNFCHIYLESGQTLSQTAVNKLIDQFDSAIHPGDTSAFGDEPNPGIDGDPKIYILLLNIRDGFTPGASSSYIAGYFDPTNEYALSAQNPHSNQKEILFLNINQAIPVNASGTEFFTIIAHEFQHMIHWEQKTHQRGLNDDTWISEAMAQVARTYCGYGPDYASVLAYETDLNRNVNHSLVNFDETVGNYGMVYMWAQYFKDRFDQAAVAVTKHPVFWNMLHNSFTGISEVNNAMSVIASSKNFASSFEDWAIANFFGNGTSIKVLPGNTAWLFTTIDTWGSHNGFSLPGLFPSSRQNQTTLQSLSQWSIGYYSYTPASGNATGTVSWTRNDSNTLASFIDGDTITATVTASLAPNSPITFTNIGYLIYVNPSSTSYLSGESPADTVVRTAISPTIALSASPSPTPATAEKTPHELLSELNADATVRRLAQQSGKPQRVYIDSWFREREKTLRTQGFRPSF